MKIKEILTKSIGKKRTAPKIHRRRSNWYIYLISFAATFALLSLIVLAYQEVLFGGGSRTGGGDYVPDPELDATILLMLGDKQGDPPHMFMMLNYRPADEVIMLVPFSADTVFSAQTSTRSTITGTLTHLYSSGGAALVTDGISRAFEIDLNHYIEFDRASFISFTEDLGEVPISVPFDFTHSGVAFSEGENDLSGEELFIYLNCMNNDNFPQVSKNYDLTVLGEAISSLINNNLNNLNAQTIQRTFNKALNNASTNITIGVYRSYQQALLYTSNVSVAPAGYILPMTTESDDGLVLTNRSIADILNRFSVA
jgi:uncharacterized protein YejL (UPF0352 family)